MFEKSKHNPVLRLSIAGIRVLIWRCGGIRSNAADISPAWVAWGGLGCRGPGWPLVGLVWAMRRVRVLFFHFMGVIPTLQLLVILIGELVAWGRRGARRGLSLLGDMGICCGTQVTGWRRVGFVGFTLGQNVP